MKRLPMRQFSSKFTIKLMKIKWLWKYSTGESKPEAGMKVNWIGYSHKILSCDIFYKKMNEKSKEFCINQAIKNYLKYNK